MINHAVVLANQTLGMKHVTYVASTQEKERGCVVLAQRIENVRANLGLMMLNVADFWSNFTGSMF